MLDVGNHYSLRQLQEFVIEKMAPHHSVANDSPAYWRARMLATIMLTGSVLCTFSLGFVVHSAVSEGLWELLIIDTLGDLLCIALLFMPGPTYQTRAIALLSISFVVGVATTFFVGPLSSGPIFLFVFALMAGILLGTRAALSAIFLNTWALGVICWMIQSGIYAHDFPFFKSTSEMITSVISFSALNIVIAMSVSVLTNGLSSGHQKEKYLIEVLEQEHQKLKEAKEWLEMEIVDRRQAEEAVRSSEQKYRLLADNVSDVIWVFDIQQRRLTYISPSVLKARGYTPEEALTQSLADILTPDSYQKVLEYLRGHFGTAEEIGPGRAFSEEVQMYKKDGTTIWAEITASLLWPGDGQPATILGVTRDISERKRAEFERAKLEIQLRQSKKMESIGTLAGGIAHDFNNILSSILGFTELCQDDAPPNSQLDENLQEVFTAANRAKTLVRQILTFARQTDDEIEPIQINSIVKEALKFIRSSIPTSIEIQAQIESDSFTLGNPTQIHQLLMNMCTNAAQAMEENGGVLKVGLKDVALDDHRDVSLRNLSAGPYVELKVSDTGTGIDPSILSSIFDPYFTTKEIGRGTGMGLAMVHGIVKESKGTILVDSELGKGSVFTVYLPATPKTGHLQATEPRTLPMGNERILFVDDEVNIAKFSQQILTRLGYQVTTQINSRDALALFRERADDFDLVITDMTMPNLTGDRLAREMLSIRKDIPILLCTGHSNRITSEKQVMWGIREVVYKPIVKTELAGLVRRLLDEAKPSLN